MSATPHDGTKRGFASLIQLLDPTAIPNEQQYKKEDIKPYYIRRRRTDIADQIDNSRLRTQRIRPIPMPADEINVLQAIHDIKFESKTMNQRSAQGVRELFRTTLVKSFLSSPAALFETCEKKVTSLESKKVSIQNDSGIETDIASLRNVMNEIEDANLRTTFSRLESLHEYIKNAQIGPNNKLVIFTERLATLKHIRDFLIKKKLVHAVFDPKAETVRGRARDQNLSLVAMADGSMDETKLMPTVKAFQSGTSSVNILVATNVASEGLNLHENCHRLIHFDLPWSLITLEQRNGRIDRLGQNFTPMIEYFASEITQKTRESNPAKLKDDFWIVNKIYDRMKIAGEDLEEEALKKGFTSGEQEDEANTLKYEDKDFNLGQSEGEAFFAELLAGNNEPSADDVYLKKLPTLFNNSPFDFIKKAAELSKIRTTQSGSQLHFEVSPGIRFEVEQWPKDLKPNLEKSTLSLESNSEQMEKLYKMHLNDRARLNITFMNEIHPTIQILEQKALELFPGHQVPVLKCSDLKPGSIYFLLQGSLFNRLNEYVFQTWHLVEFEFGKSKCEQVVNLYEPDHTQNIVTFVQKAIPTASSVKNLSDFENKRIQKLAHSSIDWMKEQMKQAREARKDELMPKLKDRLSKIKDWEVKRTDYLKGLVDGSTAGNEVHGGIHAQRKKAEEDVKHVGQISNEYREFISNSLVTSDESDVKILAIFISNLDR